ncbi:MAG: M20/M25/M40 family metallo-hydrolase [Verrucomicrobia bacterium]|nr:M20/M25/M40 family metallo-hydrolase [Verrucomicrobiota bacterium]
MMPVEKLLCELVALPSVNPAFLPAGDPWSGEQRVAEFLAAVAARGGLEIEFQAVSPHRANLLARLTPAGKVRARILLAPHLDTVGGEPVVPELFIPRLRDGRVHGRGACDTKGSVAAMLTALVQLARSERRPVATEIVFAGLVDEEHGQAGSRALVRRGFRADLAIVGEPTRLRVITAHKGNLWLRLETRGRPAHGSQPELGRNAVHLMARIVHLLETQYAARLRRRRHRLLGHPTVSVGTIHGGSQTNVVPAACAITVDRRTIPGETRATVRRELLALLRRHRLAARLADTKDAPCLPLETGTRSPLVRAFLHSVGQTRPHGANFFCDAAVFAHGGTPSVVFGPGDIAQAHTAHEWVSVRQLEQATRLLTRFLQSLP